MQRCGVFLFLCLFAVAATTCFGGQDDASPWRPVQAPAKPPQASDGPGLTSSDVPELQRCLMKLRAEQEALAADLGIVQTAFKAPQTPDKQEPLPQDLAELQRCLLKLEAEREALATEQSTANQVLPGDLLEGPEVTKLRMQLGQLMNKLNGKSAPKKAPEPPGPVIPLPIVKDHKEPSKKGNADHHPPAIEVGPSKVPAKGSPDAAPPADPWALATVLYKAGNFDLALKAYRMVNLSGVRADEKAPIQYLMGTCLRKMGKLEEAMGLYREAANVRGDEPVAACAQWQLAQLRWRSEFELQLKDLRARRLALEATP